MATHGRNGERLLGAINVTPLVDVCLVILIIFMVVAPYLVRGHPVQLPRAESPEALPDEDAAMALTLERDGTLYIGDERVLPQESVQAVRRRLGGSPGQPVRLKADSRLTYGDVRGLLKVIQEAGSRQVVLVVQPSGDRPREVPLAPAGEPRRR